MESMESSGGSYVWKSIHYGTDVIEKGVRWRIGDGCVVKIWQHHWLPIKHPTRISSPLKSMESATMDLLIDTNTRSWNSSIIDGLFAPNKAALIKRIPLARLACADEMFWPFTQHGNYNCKSRYQFLKELHDGPPSSDVQPNTSFWKKVWMLKVPNKIKNFVWRACKDSIPTKVNLRRRSIPIPTLCDRCSVEEETSLHALWSCKELDQVWSGLTS